MNYMVLPHKSEGAQFQSVQTLLKVPVETQLIISRELNYLDNSDFNKLNNDLTEIQKMLYSFIKKLKEN